MSMEVLSCLGGCCFVDLISFVHRPSPRMINSASFSGIRSLTGFSQNSVTMSRHKVNSPLSLHVLSISAAVTSIKWRPPASTNKNDGEVDRHESMLAVASARQASAGGSGVLGLWSCDRPFMPLSVVEGHEEGAIGDFVWLETPYVDTKTKFEPLSHSPESMNKSRSGSITSRYAPNATADGTVVLRGSLRGESESILFDNKERDDEEAAPRIWQHLLSVGRDGRCLIQSLVRGKHLMGVLEVNSCFLLLICAQIVSQGNGRCPGYHPLALLWQIYHPFRQAMAHCRSLASTRKYQRELTMT